MRHPHSLVLPVTTTTHKTRHIPTNVIIHSSRNPTNQSDPVADVTVESYRQKLLVGIFCNKFPNSLSTLLSSRNTINPIMASSSPLFLSILLLISLSSALAGSDFVEQNPIHLASDRFRELESSVLHHIGATRHSLAFARYAYTFGKRYESGEEMKLRFGHFVESLELIKSTNKNKDLPYKLSLNEFADISWEEFRQQKLGAAQNCSATTKSNYKLTDALLPPVKDWREEGIVSPVKNQGGCGSCWTFSTTGALEAAYKQAFGKDISLSEQQLVDCAGAFNNYGCNGGLPSQAFEYIKYIGGLETETVYPYTGEDGVCKFTPNNAVVKVVDSVNITLGAEDELKQAVAFVRPVSIAFQVIREFRLYKEGVFTSNHCGNTPMDVNHAVLAVGYGVEHGIPYWLIKNSWGANWGDHGYFKMEMGKNMCGIATCASYPVVA